MCLIYVYCISTGIKQNKVTIRNISISNIRIVDIVQYNNIQAVVSRVSDVEFEDEAIRKYLENPEWVKEKALIHEDIIEEIMENYSVLPMRFLTIYNTEQNLLEFLKNHYEKILDNLMVAEMNIEYSVRVYCNKEILKKALMEEEEIKTEIEVIASKPKGVAYMLMKKLNERIAVSIQNNLNCDAQDIYKAIESISEKIMMNEFQKSDESLIEKIFNVVILINRENYLNKIHKIEKLNEEYSEKGYHIEASGPWPIYNFINI